MLLRINNGCKEFSGEELFSNINFEIKGTEKVAVIGRNGCGKTTLMNIITGNEQLDKGDIFIGNNVSIGYLSQKAFDDETKTVQQVFDEVYQHVIDIKFQMDEIALRLESEYTDELLEEYSKLQHEFEALNGYNYNQEQITLFTRFGFNLEDRDRVISTFSGGQKTRIAFVKLLLEKPDILLLDEPTNHLDMETIEWLEGYLIKYPKAIIVVSHDRMFMDKVVGEVYEFDFKRLNHYVGNYTKYVELKKTEMERMSIAYRNQQMEIKRLEDLIEKFRYKKNKAAFAQSKIKYLDRMERIERPQTNNKNFKLHFDKNLKGGTSVINVENLVIGYDKPLCEITFQLINGQKLGVIGPNGLGKSTFLKTIMGQIDALSGDYLYGHQIEVGYFDQSLAQVDSTKTILDEIWDLYPEYDHTEVRKILGSFMFTADDVYKTCDVLSGGEKVRLSLAKLMLSKANLLILDEPTNHLDIAGKEALENALSEYDGTVIVVSHDRYFINKLASCILYVGGEATKFYNLKYSEYQDKIKGIEPTAKQLNKKQEEKVVQPVVLDAKTQREIAKKIATIEKQIAKAEQELEDLRALRFEEEYYHDYQKLNKLEEAIDEKHNEIDNLMAKWEEYAG